MDRIKSATSYTAAEIARRGLSDLPPEFSSAKHLIYSSPATLAFNSPGAEGFGVKRAALAVPGSVELLVAPGCCARNTSLVSGLPGYRHRFFYYIMDETDIVTGRHLRKIPEAVREVVNSLPKKPSVVMICITCVDALLGTDMERVCRKAEERAGVPVRPSYMYALTREGKEPPMAGVRRSIYSLLKKREKHANAANILGFFAPLLEDCELYTLLRRAGVSDIREISRCKDMDEYLRMAEANFNLVLNPEARFAAEDFARRLEIPYIELKRLYRTDKIENQYKALAAALGCEFKDENFRTEAEDTVSKFREKHGALTFALGECQNADPFELAAALLHYGFNVSEIYGTITDENFVYVKQLAKAAPKLKIYSNLEPTMIYYDMHGAGADVTIGKDAGYYNPDIPNLMWNGDIQPFGYAGVRKLFRELDGLLDGRTEG